MFKEHLSQEHNAVKFKFALPGTQAIVWVKEYPTLTCSFNDTLTTIHPNNRKSFKVTSNHISKLVFMIVIISLEQDTSKSKAIGLFVAEFFVHF